MSVYHHIRALAYVPKNTTIHITTDEPDENSAPDHYAVDGKIYRINVYRPYLELDEDNGITEEIKVFGSSIIKWKIGKTDGVCINDAGREAYENAVNNHLHHGKPF